MTNNYIKVTQGIAEARENILRRETLKDAFTVVSNEHYVSFFDDTKILQEWYLQQNDNGLSMMMLLLGHYEIIRTPEEKFNDMFDKHKDSVESFNTGFWYGMVWTANLFNLNVKGVNDNE